MKSLLPVILSFVFPGLALIHVYWALGGSGGKVAALPHINGEPAFRPSSGGTLLVALALLLCALLVTSVSGLLPLPVPRPLLTWPTYGLSFGLLLRAVGDFRLVGFFKRVRGSRFARLDTLVFSPLCLALSVGVFVVGYGHVA
jgi:hypothetical protein